jgi:hypothetical protein
MMNFCSTRFSYTFTLLFLHPMNEVIYQADFKTLKHAYLEVKTFLEQESSGPVSSLQTKIENDLGMAGDDNAELLEKFVEKYQLNIEGFDYSKHFLSEGELFGSWAALIRLLLFPIYFFLCFITAITLGKIDLTDKKIGPRSEHDKLNLSFGDLLVWRLTGFYNLRENVRVKLIPAK